ncbi:sodium:proton antiporter [Nakamurella sp. YIM 132087]|uniref:Sodium:proton antiporter n=1 Tax=Nakamurella alba TaxID=2665158 RepID=A0A7K1FIQ1_9ACTN|nr:sodium:proton antiporter [Nakamurella alba]MTD13992.1 sodium:proton antiporter [Nakamurella alba]
MTALVIAVAGLLVVAGATALAPRLRIAAPLILVLLGIGVSFLPFVPAVEIDPEWILAGVLPPLLYSASVSMPSMNFRREFPPIASLSVVLVVLSAVGLGAFFHWVIPGLDLWWGIALGAIISPTDAVATSIVKKLGVSGRVVSVLEGESLLNDATALVMLRTAVAATAASISFWGAFGQFLYSVAIAVALGILVGQLNLLLRARVTDATVNTVLSFTVPFLASVPAELLEASGLVAAVIAGLVTGYGAARKLPPRHRLSDNQNWRVIEMVLEGAIFLVMGLELAGLLADVEAEHAGIGRAAVIAACALALTVLIRAVWTVPLLLGLRRRARRSVRLKPRLDALQERFDKNDADGDAADTEWLTRGQRPAPSPVRVERFRTRIRRGLADIDYLLARPMGWRDGGILIWAGMRGAVTLAAAQTLPEDTPQRPFLVLIAFMVATGSLLVQGGTLGWVVGRLRQDADADSRAETDRQRGEVVDLLRRVAGDVQAEHPDVDIRTVWTTVLDAQRAALLDARDDGIYDAEVLRSALLSLDADQISIELRGGGEDF